MRYIHSLRIQSALTTAAIALSLWGCSGAESTETAEIDPVTGVAAEAKSDGGGDAVAMRPPDRGPTHTLRPAS